jgi:hypothetical protein
MSIIKAGLLTATSAVGLLSAVPARADVYVAAPQVRYESAPRWHGWHRRRLIYPRPVYSYSYGYRVDPGYYQYDFGTQVRAELGQIEGAVRERVEAGQLDGNALTAMESARDDIQQDVVDVSAKGYLTDADRAHVEGDIQALRQRFGC